MKRITRYILTELLTVFAVTLLAMTVLMVLVAIVRQAVRDGMGIGPVMKMIPYVLPEALRFSVPATILLAACTVFGRMSADNEIVAIKSMGVHPRVVFIPAFALAFVMSVVAVCINDIAVTWGRDGMYRVAMESLEQIVYGVLRTQKSYTTRRLTISVKAVDGHRLVEPFISTYMGQDQDPTTVTARFAELTGDATKGVLRMKLVNGALELGDDYRYDFNEFDLEVPLADVHKKGGPVKRASDCAYYQLSEQRRLETVQLASLQEQMAERAALQMAMGSLEELDNTGWQTSLQEWHSNQDRLNRLNLEPYRRWASGFSCFCFVFVGAPLAVRMRTTNFFTTFAACFLPILFIYYPLLTYTGDQAKDGLLPAYSVWAGNVVLVTIGGYLLKKTIRH